MNNIIPPITHSLGKHWNQPRDISAILIDDSHALMTKEDFKALQEYSSTIPSGVYNGKCWKRHDGAFDPTCAPEKRRWLLMWFADGKLPDTCSINAREILIA